MQTIFFQIQVFSVMELMIQISESIVIVTQWTFQ